MAIVRMNHLRSIHYCAKGVIKFFEKNNLDIKDFVKNGIDESKLLPLNDAMANKAVEVARKEQS